MASHRRRCGSAAAPAAAALSAAVVVILLHHLRHNLDGGARIGGPSERLGSPLKDMGRIGLRNIGTKEGFAGGGIVARGGKDFRGSRGGIMRKILVPKYENDGSGEEVHGRGIPGRRPRLPRPSVDPLDKEFDQPNEHELYRPMTPPLVRF